MSGTAIRDSDLPHVRAHLRHLGLQGLSANTLYHRERALERLAAALAVPLLEATPEILYDWRASLRTASGTTAGYLSHVKGFYDWAVAAGLAEESPAAALPVPRQPRRGPRPIPEEDLMLALACTTPASRVRPFMVLAGWAGLRACEIAGLRMEHLRLRDDPPVVMVSWQTAKGGRERVVELCPFAVAEMRAAGLPARGLAFPGADGRPLRPWMVSKVVNEHLHGCGTASTLHCLRHRFATQLAQRTHDPQLVKEMLGHESIQTSSLYMAFSRKGATAAVASLPVPEEYGLEQAG